MHCGRALARRWEVGQGGKEGRTYSALEAVEMESAVEGANKLARQLLAALFAHTDLAAGGATRPLLRPVPLGALARRLLGPGAARQRAGQGAGARIGICEPQLVAAVGCLSAGGLPGPVASVGGGVGGVGLGQVAWRPIRGIGCHGDGHPSAGKSEGATPSGRAGAGEEKEESVVCLTPLLKNRTRRLSA